MSGLVLAHAGGWDELLLFGVIGAVVWLFVRFAERRSQRRSAQEDEESSREEDQEA
ncbi:MAG: hypothetical protein ACRDXD_03300 [Acidimicrobiia bacterium]